MLQSATKAKSGKDGAHRHGGDVAGEAKRAQGASLRVATHLPAERGPDVADSRVSIGCAAGNVSSVGGPRVQRKCACGGSGNAPCAACEEEERLAVQRKGEGEGHAGNERAPAAGGAQAMPGETADPPPASDPVAVRGKLGEGRSLDAPVRTRMERGFGASFAGVRIHTDASAARLSRQLHARAFTVGSDVAFAAGEFNPGTPAGDALIAHELAHTLQQRGGGVSTREGQEPALENEADAAAAGALGLAGVTGIPSRSGLRLQRCDDGSKSASKKDAGTDAATDAGVDAALKPDAGTGADAGEFLARDPIPSPAPKGCKVFKDQAALDSEKDAWRAKIDKMQESDVVAWVIGKDVKKDVKEDVTKDVVKDAMKSVAVQRKCLLGATRVALSAKGLSIPAGDLVRSGHRSAKNQATIWTRKFEFTGRAFGRISGEARKKCGPLLLPTDIEWDPSPSSMVDPKGERKAAHKKCWDMLSADEKQKEILMTSSAPGISRHHWGSDFDIGRENVDTDLSAEAWEGKGAFSDTYRWLRRNASTYGFIQSFEDKGGYGVGYTAERWHWSYYPVAQALLEWVEANRPTVVAALKAQWAEMGKKGDAKQFSFIEANWEKYMFNVERKGRF